MTDNAVYADEHNFYKVEKWTRDGAKVDSLLYAGNRRESAGSICIGRQAQAANPIDHPTANAGVAAVAEGLTAS